MLEIQKIDDSTFNLSGSGKTLALTKDQYEDLFYAVPPEPDKYLNTTALYRLFTDSIFSDEAKRAEFLEMLKGAGSQDQVLKDLQDKIKKLNP